MPNCDWCGKDFKNQGGLNLHKSIHCKKKPVQDSNDECQGGCDWRLLNRNSAIEVQAIQKGYKEVCTECLDLR